MTWIDLLKARKETLVADNPFTHSNHELYGQSRHCYALSAAPEPTLVGPVIPPLGLGWSTKRQQLKYAMESKAQSNYQCLGYGHACTVQMYVANIVDDLWWKHSENAQVTERTEAAKMIELRLENPRVDAWSGDEGAIFAMIDYTCDPTITIGGVLMVLRWARRYSLST